MNGIFYVPYSQVKEQQHGHTTESHDIHQQPERQGEERRCVSWWIVIKRLVMGFKITILLAGCMKLVMETFEMLHAGMMLHFLCLAQV